MAPATILKPFYDFATVDWIDHVRDLLSFTENYLPQGPYDPRSELPVHLERLDPMASASRARDGVEGRNLVALGHSLGGCVL